jgi:aspartyl-tRNA(Asn)/glutamyl-tRNA(Gln) amidotransferase subunit A
VRGNGPAADEGPQVARPGGREAGKTAGPAAVALRGRRGLLPQTQLAMLLHYCGGHWLSAMRGDSLWQYCHAARRTELRRPSPLPPALCCCAGRDCHQGKKDSTSANKPKSSFLNSIKNNVKGLKVGVPKEYRVDNMPKEVDDLWQEGIKILKDNGAIIKDISLPHTKYALPTYYIIAPAEASSNLARYDGVRYGFRAEGKDLTEMYENTRSKGFGAEVKRRIMIGTYVLSSGYYDAYYLKAQKVRNLIKMDFDNAYKDVDVILTPTTPTPAFKFGENTDDPIAMYLNDIFTVTANLAGLPAISLPIKYNKDGLPLALQLFGKSFDEQTLLNTAYSIEQQVNFKSQVKDWWM